jgi:hypothetical protein
MNNYGRRQSKKKLKNKSIKGSVGGLGITEEGRNSRTRRTRLESPRIPEKDSDKRGESTGVRLRSWPGKGFDGGTSWMPYAPDRSNRNNNIKRYNV